MPNILRFILSCQTSLLSHKSITNLTGDSALGTKTVLLQGADQGKVYVHKKLLNGKVARGWGCFPSATITSFVEYLYQGDYTPPVALVASSGASEGTWTTPPGTSWGATLPEIGWHASSTGQERREETLPCYAIGQVNANPPPSQPTNLLTTKMFSSPTLGYSYSPENARNSLSQACASKDSWRL